MYRKTIVIAALMLSMFSLNSFAGGKTHKHVAHHTGKKVDERKQVNTPIECLAKTVYYEARGESDEGKRWVARSVMNRTKHPKFPKDVCSVVAEKHNGVCQFSWYCKRMKVKHDESWNDSMKVAFEVMSTEPTNESLKRVLFFHAISTRPSWGRHYKKIKRVEHHVFYGDS